MASAPTHSLATRRAPEARPTRTRSPRAAAPGPRLEATSSAYQRLRELIVTGRLTPGAPLVELELSEGLGVSRTPVRAALQRLQQEGLVAASRAGRMLRSIVAPLTADDMREVFLMAGALEAAAARLAAGLEPVRREALADEMARTAGDLLAAASAQPPDLVGAQELHGRFHRRLGAAAGPRLLAELEVFRPQAERYERVYASGIVGASDEAAREHADIVEAVRQGDGQAAEAAVARHWRDSADRYSRLVTILGERGNW